jgi:hypothetical protein
LTMRRAKRFYLQLCLLACLMLAACGGVETTESPVSTSTPSAAPIEAATAEATETPEASATPTVTPADRWLPAPGDSWQIQFVDEPINTDYEVDICFLDLFDTSAELVEGLHQQGRRAVCYISVGSWEDWRPDAADFPEVVLGNDYEGWPGERWLDYSNLDALGPIMAARLDLCAAKGFDGVDPDNIDAFTNDTGFPLTQDDALAYALWLADQAHARGLGIGLKNAPEMAERLAPEFDWMQTESCFEQGWCAQTAPFLGAGKAVFAIEYVEEGMSTADFCPRAADLGISAILKEWDLEEWVEGCD